MKNGWTGGQYSLLRLTVGLTFAVFGLARLLENTRGSVDVSAILRGLVVLAWLLFATGLLARTMAALLALLSALEAWEYATDPNFAPLLYTAFLLWNVFVPRAPFGSLPAVGRADPAGSWRMPAWLHAFAWACVVLALVGTAVVLLATRGLAPREFVLHGQSESAPAPEVWWLAPASAWALIACASPIAWMALARGTRPWAFALLACVLIAGAALVDRPPGSTHLAELFLPAWVLAMTFLFDPAWIPARGGDAVERLYYDGECGLCQRAVRFVLAEDPAGRRFRFAPLQGETFARAVERDVRARLPDSIVVQTADGRLLVRTAAALHVLERLGGFWRVLGTLSWLVPRPVRDLGYDAVASVRKRLFAPPAGLCPLGPPHVTQRFDP